MNKLKCLVIVTFACLLRADTKTQDWPDPSPTTVPATVMNYVDSSTGTILPGDLPAVLKLLPGWAANPKGYAIINVIRWKDVAPSAAGGSPLAPAPETQTWYVYNSQHDSDEDISTRNRVYGTKTITFVYIHLNRPAVYSVSYTVATTRKMPAYINHLTGLLGLFQSKTVGEQPEKATPADKNIWGHHDFTIPYVPSDVTFTPDLRLTDNPIKGLTAQKFDNEGLYFIDFSVGVPIRKISEIQYDSTNNVISPTKVSQGNLLALFNGYFVPVDIKGAGFSPYPHFVGGVKIGSQPLKTAVIGLGYGPALANFYFGLLLTTTDVPTGTKCGSSSTVPAGTTLQNHTCPGFGFGLNLGVGAISDALKKKN